MAQTESIIKTMPDGTKRYRNLKGEWLTIEEVVSRTQRADAEHHAKKLGISYEELMRRRAERNAKHVSARRV